MGRRIRCSDHAAEIIQWAKDQLHEDRPVTDVEALDWLLSKAATKIVAESTTPFGVYRVRS